jgi:hypothetical protein
MVSQINAVEYKKDDPLMLIATKPTPAAVYDAHCYGCACVQL